MMCAKLLRAQGEDGHGRLYRANERVFEWILGGYETTLGWVLRHQPLMLLVTLAMIGVSIYLYVVIRRILPQQDTGMLIGTIQGDQNSSFQAMRGRLESTRRSSARIQQWPTSPHSRAAAKAQLMPVACS